MTRVIYNGPPRGVAILVQTLKDEGLQVDYRPPMERRTVEAEILQVAINVGEGVVGSGLAACIGSAIRKFRTRVGNAPVSVEVESDDFGAAELDI